MAATAGSNSEIHMIKNLDGITIKANKRTIFSSLKQREIKKWENYINELLAKEFIDIEANVEGRKIFYVTENGLQYVDARRG